MSYILDILRDGRRSQRGSVLSGVLIIVAFLAVMAGGLLTELSTNFLLSTTLVGRVTDEATVDSGVELAIAQLQDTGTTPLFSGCPGSVSWPANGRTATVADASCYPVIDSASPQALTPIAGGAPFMHDGVHARVPSAGIDLYLSGDSDGNLFAFGTGSTVPAWTYATGGEIVGTPLVMSDVSAPPDGVTYVVPATNIAGGTAAGCPKYCVALLGATGAAKPSPICIMAATSTVAVQPAAGIGIAGVAYFGDSAGNLSAYSAISAGQSQGCAMLDQQSIASDVNGAGAVVAGPFVFNGSSGGKTVDHVFAVVASGSGGYLVHYTFSLGGQPDFKFAGSLALPGVAAGAALLRPTSQIAIAFTNGQVAIVQIGSKFTMGMTATQQLPASPGDAPAWTSFGALGVTAGSTLYVLDGGLNITSTFTAPSPITTAPSSDNGGDWFFGTSSGVLYEAQSVGGSNRMTQTVSYGGAGSVTSGPVALPCSIGICIYLGSSDGNVYFAGLDARDAVLDSCLGSCAAGHFSLRVGVEVGAANSPRTVRVQSWSYYSP